MMSSRTCTTCGAPLTASARFCPVCGATAPAAPEPAPAPVVAPVVLPAPAGPARKTPGTATASLIMGLMTWLLPFALIGLLTFWVTAPLAVGCGVAARRTIEADPDTFGGSGQANTGLALGLSALLVATLLETLMVFSKLT